MVKTAHKHKELSGALPEVLQLYRNNKFVTDSLSSACVSSVKITADGQIKTKAVGKVGDRHLLADLNLPGLQERCAVSANEDLFKLSKQLAENETEDQAQEQAQRQQVEAKKHGNPVANPWARFANVHSKDCKYAKLANNFAEQPTTKPQTPKKCEIRINPIPASSVERKPKKIQGNKYHLKTYSHSSEESLYDTAETSQETVECKKAKVVKPTAKCLKQVVKPRLDKTKQWPMCNQKCHNCYQQKYPKVCGVGQHLKRLVFIFDDWHTFSLLSFLCTFAYVIYILCYDIDEYANEERRYLAKMESACFIAKSFYYLMRLLKVDIF